MILLVHSCDSRLWLKPHWERYFKKSGWDIEYKYILGEGEFSDQLKEELSAITDEYIWYTLDDFFIAEPIDWNKYEAMAMDMKMDALRVQPNVGYDALPYRFKWEGDLLKQLPHSEYTMTMQCSIWRREYFLECLTPGLNPWELERASIGDKFGDVYFVPRLPFWYKDCVRKGALADIGRVMIKDS